MKSATSTATALLLIDVQQALSHPTFYGLRPRSTPNCEENIATLLNAARKYNTRLQSYNRRVSGEHAQPNGQSYNIATHVPVKIIHVHHHSTNPESPLYPGNTITVDVSSNGSPEPSTATVLGTDPMPCSAPIEGEPVMTKSVNSAFVGTNLEEMLKENQIRQLIVVGLITEHCVGTTVRMGANMGVVNGMGLNGEVVEEGRIVLVSDGCAAFGKAKYGFDGETVHRVNLASLDEEFADIENTADVLKAVFGIDKL